MSFQTTFHRDPGGLPGPGGAYLRGEAPLPRAAVWIPCAGDRRAATLQRVQTVCAGMMGLTGVGWLVLRPTDRWIVGTLLSLAIVLGLSARRKRSPPPPLPSGRGRHGMLLLNDHLVYRVGDDCAVVLRRDILGIERRKRPGNSVVGAFILAGHTGRGALPCPQPGPAPLAHLRAWRG